jgi:hypothetical protein
MRIPASWFGSSAPPHTRMWHDPSCTNPQLPSNFIIPDTLKCAVVLEALKDEAFGGGANAPPSLTASARAGPSRCWVGAKKRAFTIAVETVIAHRPPHRSVRAQLRHTVLTLSI